MYSLDHIRQALQMFHNLVQSDKNTASNADRWQYLSDSEVAIRLAREAVDKIVDTKNTICERCLEKERESRAEPEGCYCHTMRMPPCSFCCNESSAAEQGEKE